MVMMIPFVTIAIRYNTTYTTQNGACKQPPVLLVREEVILNSVFETEFSLMVGGPYLFCF